VQQSYGHDPIIDLGSLHADDDIRQYGRCVELEAEVTEGKARLHTAHTLNCTLNDNLESVYAKLAVAEQQAELTRRRADDASAQHDDAARAHREHCLQMEAKFQVRGVISNSRHTRLCRMQ
jgi:hypothetical protein